MQMRKHQTGLGMLGWLIVLAIASFALTCFFKIGPLYLEYWQVRKALDLVVHNPAVAAQSKPEIAAAIERQFDVSRIDAFKPTDIRVNEIHGGRELDATYEKRVPLISNIDVVVKFDQLKYNLSAVK